MENSHQKGLLSKISVMRHYTQRGWYVYNETMGTGPIDIVIVNPNTGEVRFIDVKTMSFRSSTAKRPNTMINRSTSDVQKKLGVKLVYYNTETGDVKE